MSRRPRLWLALILAASIFGCGVLKFGKPSQDQAVSDAQSALAAAIQVNYSHPRDYLTSLSVTEYSSAYMVAAQRVTRERSSVVRFVGGIPIWRIQADISLGRGLLDVVPGIDAYKKFAVNSVKYGIVPPGFVQEEPAAGSPEPIQPGHYYVFSVNRHSGSTSLSAIHVAENGALDGYDAEPRAGTSFQLCCDVNPNFASGEAPSTLEPSVMPGAVPDPSSAGEP